MVLPPTDSNLNVWFHRCQAFTGGSPSLTDTQAPLRCLHDHEDVWCALLTTSRQHLFSPLFWFRMGRRLYDLLIKSLKILKENHCIERCFATFLPYRPLFTSGWYYSDDLTTWKISKHKWGLPSWTFNSLFYYSISFVTQRLRAVSSHKPTGTQARGDFTDGIHALRNTRLSSGLGSGRAHGHLMCDCSWGVGHEPEPKSLTPVLPRSGAQMTAAHGRQLHDANINPLQHWEERPLNTCMLSIIWRREPP